MIIGFVALSTIPTLATFSPIMRAWLWPHLAWAYALGPAGNVQSLAHFHSSIA